MCCIDSTSGTMPGCLVTSMCWIVLPRNLRFSSDEWVALRGLVFNDPCWFFISCYLRLVAVAVNCHCLGRKRKKPPSGRYGILPDDSGGPAIASRGGLVDRYSVMVVTRPSRAGSRAGEISSRRVKRQAAVEEWWTA